MSILKIFPSGGVLLSKYEVILPFPSWRTLYFFVSLLIPFMEYMKNVPSWSTALLTCCPNANDTTTYVHLDRLTWLGFKIKFIDNFARIFLKFHIKNSKHPLSPGSWSYHGSQEEPCVVHYKAYWSWRRIRSKYSYLERKSQSRSPYFFLLFYFFPHPLYKLSLLRCLYWKIN